MSRYLLKWPQMHKTPTQSPPVKSSIACIGAINIDTITRTHCDAVLGTSNPAVFEKRIGGVAYNVARNLAMNNAGVTLLSIIGAGEPGDKVREEIERTGINVDHLHLSNDFPTGQYFALEDHLGKLIVAAAETRAIENWTLSDIATTLEQLKYTDLWFAETNLTSDQLRLISTMANTYNIPLALDAVSMAKANRLKAITAPIEIIFCNLSEASSLLGNEPIDIHDAAIRLHIALPSANKICVSNGSQSISVFCNGESHEVIVTPIEVEGRLTTGAGDALISGTLIAQLNTIPFIDCVKAGITSARNHILTRSQA